MEDGFGAAVEWLPLKSQCLCGSDCRAADEAAGRDSWLEDGCVFTAGSLRAAHTGLKKHGYQSM